MKNNPSTVAKEGANNRAHNVLEVSILFRFRGGKERREVLESPFSNRVFGGRETPHPSLSHAPLLPVVIYVLLLPALVYNYAIFSRGESYFFVSGDAPGSKSARVAGVHRWSMRKMEWGPASSKKADRGGRGEKVEAYT